MSLKTTNKLAAETSPYLRQHMHNPVQWYAWGNEAWERAEKENKLVLISIGYSACHWCHVMEHQCFENEALAAFMNEHFINIKVDREERPDIDNIYMDAVQLMTGRGGWPLNCFALPDKRPVYGGTYFPPEQWQQVLQNLADVYVHQPEKAIEYAEKLVEGLKESEQQIIPPVGNVQPLHPENALPAWKTIFDNEFGGPRKAPKFPLPVNYVFLLRYGHLYNDAEVLAHVEFTLQQMAHGGIYDHVGGGFARYSVDAQWHVPHFEKMLYDNAQLISLYAEAFERWKNPLFKQVVQQTIDFVNRELLSPEGLFYSALDADTNGEEGDFYVWTSEELKSVLTEKEFETLDACYGIDSFSDWEHGKNVLRLLPGTDEVNKKNAQPVLKKLFEVREKRTRPGLDTKILTSWNALMITALCKAGVFLNDKLYIEQAEKSYNALKKYNADASGQWIHCRQGNEKFISCFADDLALIAEAQLALYEATFNEKYIGDCHEVHALAMNGFFDEHQGLFTFSSRTATDVIVHKTEVFDNVIPASNSVWAQVLLKLGSYLGKPEIFNLGETMTTRMAALSVKTPTACGQWLINELIILHQREVAVCGTGAMAKVSEMRNEYLPQALFAVDVNGQSGLALLESRLISGQTLIYVCHKNTCNLAVETAAQALQSLRQVSE